MKLIALVTGAMAPLMAVGAAYYLGRGSTPLPAGQQSSSGEGETDQAHRREARRLSAIGWELTVATAALSFASALSGYFS